VSRPDELPRLHVSQSDLEEEQSDLQGLMLELSSWEARHPQYRALQNTLAMLRDSLSKSVSQYDTLWDQNVRFAQRIRYISASERRWRRRAEDLNLSSLERYQARRTADRIHETNTALLQAEQDKLIAQLYRLRDEQQQLRTQIADVEATLRRLESELASLRNEILTLQETIARKVVTELRRIEVNCYIIIQERVSYYERTYREGEPRTHGRIVRRKYPKGKFEVLFQLDAFVEPGTDTVIQDKDPFFFFLNPDNRESLTSEAANLLFETFTVSFLPRQFTVGITNLLADEDEIGRPPKVIRVARSVEGPAPPDAFPKEDWQKDIDDYTMTQREYNEIIKLMKEYVDELKRLGRYQEAL